MQLTLCILTQITPKSQSFSTPARAGDALTLMYSTFPLPFDPCPRGGCTSISWRLDSGFSVFVPLFAVQETDHSHNRGNGGLCRSKSFPSLMYSLRLLLSLTATTASFLHPATTREKLPIEVPAKHSNSFIAALTYSLIGRLLPFSPVPHSGQCQ